MPELERDSDRLDGHTKFLKIFDVMIVSIATIHLISGSEIAN